MYKNYRHIRRQNKAKSWATFSIHLSMGLVYILVGILIWFIPSVASTWDYQFKGLFSGICLLYGAFRLYRAYKIFYHAKS